MIAGLDTSHCVDLHLPHPSQLTLPKCFVIPGAPRNGVCIFYLDEKAMRMWLKGGWGGMAAFNSWK